MAEIYKVQEEICGCHYSVRVGGNVVIPSSAFTDKHSAYLVCNELNRAYEDGRNYKKLNEEEKS